jgi:hypothetical protein
MSTLRSTATPGAIARRVENAEQQIAALALGWIQQVAGVRLDEAELIEVGKLKTFFGMEPGLLADVLAALRNSIIQHDGLEKIAEAHSTHDLYRAAGLDVDRHPAAWLQVMSKINPGEVHTIDDLLDIDRQIYGLMREAEHE